MTFFCQGRLVDMYQFYLAHYDCPRANPFTHLAERLLGKQKGRLSENGKLWIYPPAAIGHLTRNNTLNSLTGQITCNVSSSEHSKCTGDSLQRGGFTNMDGMGVRPSALCEILESSLHLLVLSEKKKRTCFFHFVDAIRKLS